MVNFLRKKSKPVAPSPVPTPTPTHTTEHTPLYSKFASSSQDVSRSVVSGPVALGSQRDIGAGYHHYGSDIGHDSRPRERYAEPMQARPRTNPSPSRTQAVPMPQHHDPYSHRTSQSQFTPESGPSSLNQPPPLRSRPSIKKGPSDSRDSMARVRNSQNVLPDAETANMYSSYLDMMFPSQDRNSVYTNGNSEESALQSNHASPRRHSQIQNNDAASPPPSHARMTRKTSNPPAPPPVRRGPLIFAAAVDSDSQERVVSPEFNSQPLPTPTPRNNNVQQHRVAVPPSPRAPPRETSSPEFNSQSLPTPRFNNAQQHRGAVPSSPRAAPSLRETSSPATPRRRLPSEPDPYSRDSNLSTMPINPPNREQATPSPVRMLSHRSNSQTRVNSTPLGPRGDVRENKRLSRVAIPAEDPPKVASPAAPPPRELDHTPVTKPRKVNGYGTPPRHHADLLANGPPDHVQASPARKVLTKQKPIQSPEKQRTVPQERPQSTYNASFGVDLRDDPFAKPAPVRLAPSTPSSRDGHRPLPDKPGRDSIFVEDSSTSGHSHTFDPYEEVGQAPPAIIPAHAPSSPYKTSLPPLPPHAAAPVQTKLQQLTPPNVTPLPRPKSPPQTAAAKAPSPTLPRAIPTTPAPEEHRTARTRRAEKPARRPISTARILPVRPDRRPEPFPLDVFLSDPNIVLSLLDYLTFYDWCLLFSTSKVIRSQLSENVDLKEVVLEHFLKTIGYARWNSPSSDPLPLSLQDLIDYMHGVGMPTYQYSQIAQNYLHSLGQHPSQRDVDIGDNVRALRAATRAYTRVVLRLRAQLEKDARSGKSARAQTPPRGTSRSQSRPATPTSIFSHGHGVPRPSTPSGGLSSPLFRLRRSPLLRVYVPSSNGEWLSDSSVLDCEEELKKAGVLGLLRTGDVVWDVAVGDEGNAGRLVWDGSYLLDLDYSYSKGGDLPKYIPTMAFPPSYFHKSIRPGSSSSNPIVRVDISQWGDQIAANLQLLQDRVRTETPQGTFHNVMRWVHRSSFFVRPPPGGRVPLQSSSGQTLFVDSGWHGSVIVETEGTNECLADLQDRCGPGVFPPRAVGSSSVKPNRDPDDKLVFKVMRERSRPGEIWLWAVNPKERLL